MDSYLNIRVLPDPEFNAETLLAALFAKLHRALGARGRGDIGISFPEHSKTPGELLRLHGTRQALSELEASAWRAGLNDYCRVEAIQQVPAVVQWRTVSRVQVKSNPQRLYCRSVRKGWLSDEEAKTRMSTVKQQRSNLPYVNVSSLSSRQHFRLFVLHGELRSDAVSGRFSAYGLSSTATVPWFQASS